MSDQRAVSRLGGLTRAARYDGRAVTEKARQSFRDSFLLGHECAYCKPIAIDPDLPQEERQRRAVVLRKLHYTRIASRPRRRGRGDGPVAA